MRGKVQPFADAAAVARIEGIHHRARLGVEVLRTVQRSLIRTGKVHARLIGVVHERGKFGINAVVGIQVHDKIVRLLSREPDEMLHAVLQGIERHAVRGVGIVEHKHLCARLLGELRRVVRTVVCDDVDVKQFLGILLSVKNRLDGAVDDVRFVMRGDEIGDSSLLTALFPLLFGEKSEQDKHDLQNNGNSNDDEHDIVDDAQHTE